VTASASRAQGRGACDACLRRARLLTALAGPLDYWCRDRARLLDALALDDGELIGALGGSRRRELQRGYAHATAEQAQDSKEVLAICRHQPSFPAGLRFASGPRALWVAPGPTRLCELAREPVVAVLGSARCSDYGREVSRSLGRGLAVAGVTLSILARDGVSAAALAGALDADGAVVCAAHRGVDLAVPAMSPATRRRAATRGCVVAEVPCGTPARQWAQAAAERVVVGLARLTILVEADESRRELAPVRVAQALARPIAAVPGRVTSTLSAGTNALLAAGAKLVRDPPDALELLGLDAPRPAPGRDVRAALAPPLRLVLEEIGSGRDTPDLLVRDSRPLPAVLHALSELELCDLVVRGDGGRYVPRATTATAEAPGSRDVLR
jgi:DNA processing protein